VRLLPGSKNATRAETDSPQVSFGMQLKVRY
jgi:hypothetical protein